MNVEVVVAKSLGEALAALKHADERARVLAGGTDLMVELRTGRTRPSLVVDIWKLDELRGLREEPAGLRIGALTTCGELRRASAVRTRFDILAAACDEVGAEQIQNRATLGGNLGTASPAADVTPTLLALEAQVRLVSARGPRDVPLDEFLIDYRRTARRADELIESILVPWRAADERRAFRKIGTRRAQSISKLVFALALRVEGGRIVAARGAAGAVAPKTVRLAEMERELVGNAPTVELVRAAARAAALHDAAPIDDVRSSTNYRRHALARALETSLRELTGLDACRS